jgi:hypothetical protein
MPIDASQSTRSIAPRIRSLWPSSSPAVSSAITPAAETTATEPVGVAVSMARTPSWGPGVAEPAPEAAIT